MTDQYFEIETTGFNIVALADAAELLNVLEEGSQYSLTHEQHQQALFIIEQAQDNLQAVLLDITNAFLSVPELIQFALAVQKAFMPN